MFGSWAEGGLDVVVYFQFISLHHFIYDINKHRQSDRHTAIISMLILIRIAGGTLSIPGKLILKYYDL